jgi:flavin-dependent dehydrogenase
LLIDRARRGPSLGESLPPAAWPLLAELGVAEQIATGEHLRTHGTLSAWGSDELLARDFIREPPGQGLQLDRSAFDAVLLEQAARAGAVIAAGANLLDVSSRGEDGHRIHLAGGRSVGARWIIDATGRSASVARRLGARRVRHDRLVAVIAQLRSSRADDRDSRLVIEACPDGWWYSALTPTSTRIAGFLVDPAGIDVGALRTRAGFEARLEATRHIAPRLRAYDYHLTGPPRATSAGSEHNAPWRGPGWIAAGDAALALDPLSSQGIFHALYTGLRAGQAVAEVLDGNGAPLVAYDQRLAEIHAAYLHNRAAVYAAEQRWANHPFWSRRSVPS